MSFALLKKEVIDAGLCQGCGLCVGSCKHIEMEVKRPKLKDYCILERDGEDCGKCYQSCPQVIQKKFVQRKPKAIYSLRSKNPEILAKAASGGVVTTLAKSLLDSKALTEIVMVQENDEKPEADIVSDSKEVVNKAGVIYGRSGVLQKLVKLVGETSEPVGIVGVPCEIRGAAELEEEMNREIFKFGLFCNSAMRTELTDKGIVCSPCCNGCPSGVNAQGYISLIRQGRYQEAVDLIRENNPLPSICGRICTNECEYGCTLIGDDHPVAIRELKKFVTEWEIDQEKKVKTKPKLNKTAKKVAIIGSGPAGLTAAFYLRRMGYAPTIFEKTDKTGGMLRFGVPQFRLPNYVLDYDVGRIVDSGVKVELNKPLGPDMTINDLKKDGFEAIFIATGQYKPRTLHLEGEDLPNVHVAITFLMERKYRYWENKDEFKGKTLGIIGGGPVAVDVAQTALRLGAEKVHLVDIMSEQQLELVLKDIPENEFKFMEYHYATSTAKITQNDDKLVLNCYKIEWGEPDENGRRPLNKVEDSDYEIPIDSIVIAVGQAVDFDQIDAATNNNIEKERNKIKVNEISFETNIPGVFAGGDIIDNSKAVAIAAIAHGKEAAISIDKYLKGEDLMEGRYKKVNSFFTGPKKPPKDYSLKPESLEDATEEINWNFEEIDEMFNEDMALKEARRCLSCNHFCSHCQDFPAIYSDLTAGEVGSQKGYTSVVVWTDKGKELVDNALKSGLFEQGKVNEDEINRAINLKSKRELMTFEKTPRQQVLDYVTNQGMGTITEMANNLKLEPKKVRYEALRLTQMMKLEMKVDQKRNEPIFTPMCD
jgi:NADPH-dependent glutamate synthase beta subunit-like oxidoreductase